jgi:hypothetical protein
MVARSGIRRCARWLLTCCLMAAVPALAADPFAVIRGS